MSFQLKNENNIHYTTFGAKIRVYQIHFLNLINITYWILFVRGKKVRFLTTYSKFLASGQLTTNIN